MSHSGNPQVNSNNNINIYFDSVNRGLSALNMPGNLTPGTAVPTATQDALKQMAQALQAKWSIYFPAITLPPSNSDSGYFGPWTEVLAGQPVPCVIQQVTADFTAWGLPLSGDTVPTTIAKQVTQEIVSQGGQAGFTSGTLQLTSAENLYWVAGYVTVAISQTENGVLYVFGASAAINI
ncbi:hypothetical protein [Pseudomonas coronafaciens]|uniref:hypothetical protein n=1 Tax=Pseudomonas coronafaciens TaxID=53409 RepID=UPI0011C393F2|nr:hypothetical protein [Pseudomonas coronafaciens]